MIACCLLQDYTIFIFILANHKKIPKKKKSELIHCHICTSSVWSCYSLCALYSKLIITHLLNLLKITLLNAVNPFFANYFLYSRNFSGYSTNIL